MTPTPTIFAPILIAAVVLFCYSCWKRLSLTALGRPDNRLDNIGGRIGDTLRYAFAQLRVVRKPYGLVHLVIFWCFLVLMIANTEFLLHGLFPQINFSKLPDSIFVPLMQMIDVVSLITLLAVTAAAIRRAVAPPYPEARTFEAFFILSLIAILMLATFGINAAKLSRMQGSVLELAKGDHADLKLVPAADQAGAGQTGTRPLLVDPCGGALAVHEPVAVKQALPHYHRHPQHLPAAPPAAGAA